MPRSPHAIARPIHPRRPRARVALVLATFAAVVGGPALVAPPASAALLKLQYKPQTAPPPAPADLTPIAPGDPSWNTPSDANLPGGNLFARPGDPAGTTADYVEFDRTVPQGIDEMGPLRGTLMYDPATVKPGLPAIISIHGGLPKGNLCSPVYRRLAHVRWAREFAAQGYITFLADFTRPTNDKLTGWLGRLANNGNPGDCMPDDGWEPGAHAAQVSLQVAVRSMKRQLARFAEAHPADPAAPAFAAAAKKVVAFGDSSGGHLATRLALRSEDPAAPGTAKERRVAGAIGISSIGDCTPSNPIRSFQKVYGLDAFPKQYLRPFAGCGPVKPDAADSPVRLYMGLSSYRDWTGRWRLYDSPLTGSGVWGKRIGWDWVGDARWPQRTCDDLNAFRPGSCAAKFWPVAGTNTHFVFPENSRPPTAKPGAPFHWATDVYPDIQKFLATVKADDEA